MKMYNITTLSRDTGYPKTLITKKIFEEKISVSNGLIEESASKRILEERRRYISLAEYAGTKVSSSFSGKRGDRVKLLAYLEDNRFFGVRHLDFSEILMGTKVDCVYFERFDLPFLEECLEEFFEGFSITGKDRICRMLAEVRNTHPVTCRLLEEFTEVQMDGRDRKSVV